MSGIVEPGAGEQLASIAATNARTLANIAAGTAHWRRDPYRGYFVVDIFDCPPFVMFSNNDCPRAVNILYERKFEPGSMALWCRYARAASSIIDIGAHVGVFALAAAALRPDLSIYAFEPNPFASARLRVNKEVNGFENIIEGRVALAHMTAVAGLSWGKGKRQIASGATLAKRRQEEIANFEFAHVQTMPLDDFATDPPGDRCLIKIDVEGAERLVFQGMRRHLEARPDIILETFAPDDCEAVNAIVLPLGYRVYAINEDTGALDLQDRLLPRTNRDRDFNQFLTVRELLA